MKISELKITVVLSGSINTSKFESILRTYYRHSVLKKNNNIIFDFSNLDFIGILELSQVALWIDHLKKEGKKLSVKLPINKNVFSFLVKYEFIKAINDMGIISSGLANNKTWTPVKAPIFPLKFHDNKDFQLLIDDLNDDERALILLGDIKDTDLVKNNIIHSVIIKELGENVFLHSKNNSANIIMTKVSYLNKNSLSKFEHNYIDKLGRNELLVLAISDFGVGLYNKLKQPYLDDKILPTNKKLKNPSHEEIIKYAFLNHSTSRTDAERKEHLKVILQRSGINCPLPTGLHKVFNIIRAHKGSLYIRSGKASVCYNFLDPLNVKIFSSESLKGKDKLIFLKGVQFRILLPIINDSSKAINLYSSTKDNVIKKEDICLNFVSINHFITEPFNIINKESVAQIDKLFNHMESVILENSKKNGYVVFDACNFEKIKDKNAKHAIVSYCMAKQKNSLSIFIINVSRSFIENFQKDYNNKTFKDLNQIVMLDTAFNPSVVGYSPKSLNKNGITSDEIKLYRDGRMIVLNYSQIDIYNSYCNYIKTSTGEDLINEKYNIYLHNKKVLIPRKYYTNSFFNLNQIFYTNHILDKIKKWFINEFKKERPAVIVGIGAVCGEIIDLIYNDFEEEGRNLKARKYVINHSDIDYRSFILAQEISVEESIAIVTDIICTGDTLRIAISGLSERKIDNIFTIVNATKSNHFLYADKSLKISSIIQKEVEYQQRLPKSWNYNNIAIFDQENNSIMQPNYASEIEPIFQKINFKRVKDDKKNDFEIKINSFLEKQMTLHDTYYHGHFVSRNNHLSYLFNVPTIVKNNIDSFVENVLESMNNSPLYQEVKDELLNSDKTNYSHIKNDIVVDYILYPSFNPGMKDFANNLSKKIPRSKVRSVENNNLSSGVLENTNLKNKNIIILDDAIVTGSTIRLIIDIAHENGAKNIFVFVILKRGTPFQTRSLVKITKYGQTNIECRYLVDTQIPIFNLENCPICNRLKEFESLKNELAKHTVSKSIIKYIETIIEGISPKSITPFLENEGNYSAVNASKASPIAIKEETEKDYFTRINLRWKLELSLTSINMRKNVREILNRRKHLKKTNLLIIKILAEEKYYFIKNQKNKVALFYPQFMNNVQETCKYLLRDSSNMDVADLALLLELFAEINDSKLFAKIPCLLKEIQNDKEKFICILSSIFLCQFSKENPSKVATDLNIIKEHIEHIDLKDILTSVIYYYKGLQNTFHSNVTSTLDSYYKTHTSLHNIKQFLVDVIDTDDRSIQNSESIYLTAIEDTSHVLGELLRFQKDFDSFANIISNEDNISVLSNIKSKLSYHIQVVQKSISLSRTIPICDVVNTINSSIKEIRTLLLDRSNQESMIYFLNNQAVDARDICSGVLQKYKSRFVEKGIKSDFFFPNDPCAVFGTHRDTYLIFDNIIDNAQKHSNASKFFVYGQIDYENSMFSIFFLDDGDQCHSNPKITLGFGMRSIQRATNTSLGSFDVYPISKFENQNLTDQINDQLGSIPFKTVCEIKLPLIKQIEVQL